MWGSGSAVAFNRKSTLNMQLPAESGWGLTVSMYEKNVIRGKAIMLFGHRMKMRGILYYSKEKCGTSCGVRVAHSIVIICDLGIKPNTTYLRRV